MNLKKITRILAALVVLIFIPAIYSIIGVALLVSHNSQLRMLILFLILVAVVLALVHSITGKFLKTWIISIVLPIFLIIIEPKIIDRNDIKFCHEVVLSECTRKPDGKIICPNDSDYSNGLIDLKNLCERKLNK